MPYRARVTSKSAVFLETPRLSVNSYEASVDGQRTPVQTSKDGYVIVPVEPGTHEVKVAYEAPVVVRVAYWTGILGWLAFIAMLLLRLSFDGKQTLRG
jgi:hypothetical protein